MANFLLIHGGWHAGWCWYRVAPRLEALGHKVIAVDLPGHGRKAGVPTPTLADYTECAVQALASLDGPAIVIGHSMGGPVTQCVCEAVPNLVAEAVYLTAIVCRDGETIAAESALDEASQARPFFQLSDDQSSVTISEEGQQKAFYHDCTPEDVRLAALCLTAQPMRPLLEPVRVTQARFGSVPRTYIECLSDVSSSLPHQRRAQSYYPPQRILQIDPSHSPFLSKPAELVDLLDLIARNPAARPGTSET